MKLKVLFLGLILFSFTSKAQSSSSIYKQLEAFNFLGNVLYIAAHPDDENTKLIAHFANKQLARTAYLSLTRGDGGQNLIGTELEESLGVLRTQELLAARKIDGGNQFFSTAKDFGYSKHPNEAFTIWDKEAILTQVVHRIRSFRPDIIINRFDHLTPGTTHGQHTASAMLSFEAFHLANKTDAFPQQLQKLKPWKPHRLFHNVSWWYYGSRSNFEKSDKSNMIEISSGSFDPVLGEAVPVIAAKSRSQHKSQGFGSSPEVGKATEYLNRIAGAALDGNNPFEGIDTSWNRVKGGAIISVFVEKIIAQFDFKAPYKSVPDLLEVYEQLLQLEDSFWKKIKLKEIRKIIKNCLGLHLQVNAFEPVGVPGENVKVNLIVNNPSPLLLKLEDILLNDQKIQGQSLNQNSPFRKTSTVTLPQEFTPPYWLLERGSIGNYEVPNKKLVGAPETPAPVVAKFHFTLNGKSFSLTESLHFRTTDPVQGVIVEPFHILPKITLQWENQILLFPKAQPKKVRLSIIANTNSLEGKVKISPPEGWHISPQVQSFTIKNKGVTKDLYFVVTPPEESSEVSLEAQVIVDNESFEYALQEVKYKHIPQQFVLQPNRIKASRMELQTPIKKVGYIKGAGDKIPESLESIGIAVEALDIKKLQLEELQKLSTVIIGIRAFNVLPSLKTKNKLLWEYVAQGGSLIIQYNTSRGLQTNAITPYPLSLSRDRVTDETAKVTLLNPNHPILNFPHQITENDFEGWILERGLYFPNQWDSKFEPLLGMNDPNETEKRGSLLVASHGKGQIIYTGLSFFRQLPKGVSGAYSLFINLISYGHEKK